MRWQLWIAELVLMLLLLAAPCGLIYCWGYLAREWRRPFSWREKVSLVALIVATSGALAWLGMFVWVAPLDDAEGWRRFAVYTHVFRYVGRGLLVMTVPALVGRPRLAAPLVLAILGTIAWWALPIYMQ